MFPTNRVSACLILLLLKALLSKTTAEEDSQESWQNCKAFLAPSQTGWGVFAAQDIQANENIDLTPMMVLMPHHQDVSVAKNSVVNDYVFGYTRESGEYASNVVFGFVAMYNHHPEPNVKARLLYRTAAAYATQDIKAGEQIFITYGETDGGAQWFRERSLVMSSPSESIISMENLPLFKKNFCSAVYAGIGRPYFEKLAKTHGYIDEFVDKSLLAPFDAGFGDARAKRNIAANERIEIGPGLFVSAQHYAGSALAPVVIAWDDLSTSNQDSLRILRESGSLKLQHQSRETFWRRVDSFKNFEDLAILPIGGRIALIRRVGDTQEANCQLEVGWQGIPEGVSVTLEVVATKSVAAGEILLLDLPRRGTLEEFGRLTRELLETEQPFNEELFASTSQQAQSEL